MRDGEEKKIEANLVYVWNEGDESVGIHSGWSFAGVEIVNGPHGLEKLLEVDKILVRVNPYHADSKTRTGYVFDVSATAELDSYCEYEPDEEPDPDLGRDDPEDGR